VCCKGEFFEILDVYVENRLYLVKIWRKMTECSLYEIEALPLCSPAWWDAGARHRGCGWGIAPLPL